MRRSFAFLALLFALTGLAARPVAAQQPTVDDSFSDEIIDTLGYPELAITVGPDGVDAPTSVAEGYYQVTLLAVEPYVAYLNFMQPPAGLSDEEATELALAAARDDLAQEGWVYAGGNNTFEQGVPVKFLIYLAAGEYRIAASYYMLEGGSEEIMRLVPLTVTGGATPGGSPVASPAATPATEEPPATVTLEETDELRYLVTPDPVPAGPQIWKITNTGEEHAHHVVMVRVPEGTTSDDIVAEFTSLMSGTPPAGEPLVAQLVFVGYAALQSGGQTTWVEYDLDPGSYAVICYVVDPHSGRPHVLDGMVTVFAVE
jgi:hypothetical protein